VKFTFTFPIHQSPCDRQCTVSACDKVVRYAHKELRLVFAVVQSLLEGFEEDLEGGESVCHRLPHDVEINDVLQTRLYSVHTLIRQTDRAHEPRSLFNYVQ
jgi:hypothetical protein